MLSLFKATLTLPGIAGIVLTIGMAVDANVLIFERIREELRLGKTVRNALDAGYAKAMLTIIDANVTTLIAALVLFQFGTGPVKGFAVTLSVGIVSSLFTAIFVSRLIFDLFLGNRHVKRLSI
jgi:preprotein translocase subunit SecD